jgi:Bacterial capsule synthesis protein PGA_cap
MRPNWEALLDTLDHLRAAGIACAGAGSSLAEARTPVVLERDGRTCVVRV